MGIDSVHIHMRNDIHGDCEKNARNLEHQIRTLEDEKISLMSVNEGLRARLARAENELEIISKWLKK